MNASISSTTAAVPHAPHRDYIGAKMGMWLFLFTEILLFAGLFLAYFVYRHMHPEDFHIASDTLNVAMGATNTVVLLTSSLTMVLAITAIQKGRRGLSAFLLVVTILCASAFMVIKYFEWTAKFHHGIYPDSPVVNALPHGQTLFYGLYFTMAGLHGLHVLVGMIALCFMLVWLIRGTRVTQKDFVKLENAGLYWHLVDLIWIYLFPLLYLI